MRILVSHCSYPSQFRRLAPALAAEGHELVFLHHQREWHAPPPEGFRLCSYQPARSSDEAAGHPYLRRSEQAVLRGQAVLRALSQLQEQGFVPDVVICHGGIRSWHFGCWLIDTHGYTKVWNLEGGIDAWSVQVDPSLPRY